MSRISNETYVFLTLKMLEGKTNREAAKLLDMSGEGVRRWRTDKWITLNERTRAKLDRILRLHGFIPESGIVAEPVSPRIARQVQAARNEEWNHLDETKKKMGEKWHVLESCMLQLVDDKLISQVLDYAIAIAPDEKKNFYHLVKRTAL